MSGVGVLTSEPAPGSSVEIELSPPASSVPVIRAAQVRRSAAIMEMGMYRVGCRWLSPLTDAEASLLIEFT